MKFYTDGIKKLDLINEKLEICSENTGITCNLISVTILTGIRLQLERIINRGVKILLTP